MVCYAGYRLKERRREMTRQYTIKLYLDHGIWTTKWDDPEVIKIMGSDTIPTPFLGITPMSKVLADLRQHNPEYIVRI